MTAVSSSTPANANATTFREAMRHLPAGVCVVSVGQGAERTGTTATSVSPFSVEPPTLLVSLNRASQGYQALARHRAFSVSVLAADHREVADAFAERGDAQSADRSAVGRWITLPSGVCVLSDAIAAFDCVLEEQIERHSHAIVIGRVRSLVASGGQNALLYWRGQYDQLGWTEEEAARAVGLHTAGRRPVTLACDTAAPIPLRRVRRL